MRAGTFLRCKMTNTIAPLFVLFVLLAGYSHVSLAQTESDLTKTLITEEQVLDQPFILVEALPVCELNQFVTFNGSQLICQDMTERVCNCPEVFPAPPPGCQNFAPPLGGGFVCLTSQGTIYCSVQCDNTSEFGDFPRNPYRCGPDTKFLWSDFVEDTHTELPECDQIRLSRRTIFAEENYLPAPCNQLTEEQKSVEFEKLLSNVQWIYRCTDCQVEQAYIQCPPPSPTASTL